ncbi:MAG: alanine racemase [Paenibacillus sp.]|jgi:alanine racemase|nr:alanine racemase [Paenibacillus sp.]
MTPNQILQGQTWIEVHQDRIEHNIQEIRKRIPSSCKFMAVVKADGYGHGAHQTARAALRAGADELAVSNLGEALYLRQNGISAPILTLSPAKPSDIDDAVDADIALPVFQASWLKEMRRHKTSGKPLRIHLKMDTGMGRIGIREKSDFEAILPLLKAEDIVVEGVYTHFATANTADPTFYNRQWNRFAEMRAWLSDAGLYGVTAHCANSAAAIQYPEDSLDMVRVGAAIFGINTCDRETRAANPIVLQPTLSMHSSLIQVKQLDQGESVGYDNSYEAAGAEWIGTVPLGYADGYFRGFHGYHLLVDGRKVPIVGNICMDQLMVRLPHYYPVGTQVTVIGCQQQSSITLEDLSDYIGSIPQQILSFLSSRVKRVYSYSHTRTIQLQK